MADSSTLNKALWTNIMRLKLCAKGNEYFKFILEKNPFDDAKEEKAAVERDEFVIIGKVLPETGIYKENGFRIQMELTSKYPFEPPKVRFLNPVYHPNMEKNGEFSHQLLSNASRWKPYTTLVDVVKNVVQYLNEPDPDYALDFNHLFMANTSRLNKPLWTNITRLKLYSKGDEHARFILEKNPFDDLEEEKVAAEQDKYIIVGRVLPKSGLYKENGFKIEIVLTSNYPEKAPEVRILTPIHHPNIEKDGTFCHTLLNNASRWKTYTTLVDIVKIVVKYINEPDPDYAINMEIGKQYIENREEYNRKALEVAQKNYSP